MHKAEQEYRERELEVLAELEEQRRVERYGGTMRPPEARPEPRLHCRNCERHLTARWIIDHGPLCRRCASR